MDCAEIARWCLLRTHAGGGEKTPGDFNAPKSILSWGGSREQGQLQQAHSRVVTESMQLLRYSLLTPHQYELNLNSTSNSVFALLHLLGGDWGLHQLLRSDEQWNLPQEETWKSLFPHSLWCLSPSCCSGISYATVQSTYNPASGPFCACQPRAIMPTPRTYMTVQLPHNSHVCNLS